jgi:hypothetical protein
LPPELSSRMISGVDVEVDQASGKEGRDVVDRGVEGEGSLDGARNRAVGSVEGPGNEAFKSLAI